MLANFIQNTFASVQMQVVQDAAINKDQSKYNGEELNAGDSA